MKRIFVVCLVSIILICMNQKYTDDFLHGKKFNALTYVSVSHIGKHSDTFCKWKCDCGKEIVARTYDVIKGRKKSCDCYIYRRKENHHKWSGFGDVPGSYWNQLVNNARSRKIKVTMTIKEAWNQFQKQKGICALTGLHLTFPKYAVGTDGTASLDRIDSSKGYTVDNIRWVHKMVNYIKRDLNDSEFIDWCNKVTTFRNYEE